MIRVDPFQAQFLKEEVCQSFVPKLRGLFEAVQGFQKFAHHIAIRFRFCAFGHLYVDELINESVQKGSVDVHLVYIQVKEGCYRKEDSKNHRFDYSCKGLIEINSHLL